MGNACIRAYGDSLIKVILAGKVARVSHKPCKYNIQIPRLYTSFIYLLGQKVERVQIYIQYVPVNDETN
jgi:hypothetical protein